MQDLEEFLQGDSEKLMKYEWCFSKLVENIDTIYIPYFDNEAQHATTKAIQRLEPTILIFMALFAGFIVIAIYLPMFTMYELM